MSNKRNGVKWSKRVPAKRRRLSALVLLEARLESPGNYTKIQITRMEREVATLKTRI